MLPSEKSVPRDQLFDGRFGVYTVSRQPMPENDSESLVIPILTKQYIPYLSSSSTIPVCPNMGYQGI
jgi:hypothetical protein